MLLFFKVLYNNFFYYVSLSCLTLSQDQHSYPEIKNINNSLVITKNNNIRILYTYSLKIHTKLLLLKNNKVILFYFY